MGLVPKTTKQSVKVFHGLTLVKVVGTVVAGGLGLTLGSALPSGLKYLVSGTAIVMFWIGSGKAPTNPNYTFGKGLSFFLVYLFDNKRFYSEDSEEYKYLIERSKKNVKKSKSTEEESSQDSHDTDNQVTSGDS